MKTAIETLAEIRRELEDLVEKEATNLWRLARTAKAHGCSEELVTEIREEGWKLHHMRNNPERVLDWKFEYETKHAFKY